MSERKPRYFYVKIIPSEVNNCWVETEIINSQESYYQFPGTLVRETLPSEPNWQELATKLAEELEEVISFDDRNRPYVGRVYEALGKFRKATGK